MVITAKKISAILALVLTIAALVVLPIKVDTRYAKASDQAQIIKSIQQLHERFDQKIEMDKASQLQMWMLGIVIENGEDRSKWSTSTRQSYATMEAERARIIAKYGGAE